MSSVERFRATTPPRLAEDLTNFLYARDRSFATAVTDTSRQTARRESEIEVDDDGDDGLVLKTVERISIDAYRNMFAARRRDTPPSDFVVTHRITTFVDALPDQLRHVIHPSYVEQYDLTEPGDLNEVHEVKYGVTIDDDGEVFIGRDISYKLRDLKEVVYKVRESKLPRAKKVHVLSEDDVIRIRTEELPETITDPGLQVQVGVDFCFLTMDAVVDIEKTWTDIQLAEQIACINALMNSLATGRPVSQVC